MMIVSDAPSCGITNHCHSEVSFMLLETSIMLLENIYGIGVTHDDQNIFIVKATGVLRTCYVLYIAIGLYERKHIDVYFAAMHCFALSSSNFW